MTPDISAEMCEGATGCASGSQACSGARPAFMPKPRKARAKATPAQPRRELRRAHGREVEAAAEPCQHAEAEQDGQSADMGHEQIEKGGARLAACSWWKATRK
jgi:hypothetical protein